MTLKRTYFAQKQDFLPAFLLWSNDPFPPTHQHPLVRLKTGINHCHSTEVEKNDVWTMLIYSPDPLFSMQVFQEGLQSFWGKWARNRGARMRTYRLWVLLLLLSHVYSLLTAITFVWLETAQMFLGSVAGILIPANILVCCRIRQPASKMWWEAPPWPVRPEASLCCWREVWKVHSCSLGEKGPSLLPCLLWGRWAFEAVCLLVY